MEQAFWTVLILSAVISVFISLIFVYFYTEFKKTYFLKLALASFIYAIHIPVINIITNFSEISLLSIILDKILLISASYLFVNAISKLTEIYFHKIIHYIYFFSFFIVIMLEFHCEDFFVKGSTGLIIFSTSFIYCGIMFFRNQTFIRFNRNILGSLFVIWGLIPFWYIPYYLKDELPILPVIAIFTVKLLVNIYIIILFFEETRKAILSKNYEISALENTKKNILSAITHDIKSPLTSLNGYCELLVSEKLGKISHEQKDKINVMKRNIDKINAITDRLSFYSKLKYSEDYNKTEKISIKKLLFDISVYIRKIIPEILIEFEFPDSELYIKIDFTRISELFYLLSDITSGIDRDLCRILFKSYITDNNYYVFENKYYYKKELTKKEIQKITDENQNISALLIKKICGDINAELSAEISEQNIKVIITINTPETNL